MIDHRSDSSDPEPRLEARLRYVLPDDISVVPVIRLSEAARRMLGAPPPGSSVVMRPATRAPAKLIDGPLVHLIENFRQPRTIAQALATLCRDGSDPEAMLQSMLPALHSLVRHHLLVPETSKERSALRPKLEAGQRVGDYEVTECVQTTRDSDVYQALAANGRRVALKLHHGTTKLGRTRLAREARLLETLATDGAPDFIDFIDGAVGPALVTSWLAARPLTDVARDACALAGRQGVKRRLALASSVIAAYVHLHDRGILHGDVHPNNVLVDREHRVWLVDFGFGVGPEISPALGAESGRGGHPTYFEPELARSLLDGRPPPPVTPESEQYAVAVLVHILLTGKPPFEPTVEQAELLARIAFEPARTALASYPAAVAAALLRSLAKLPAERLPSLGHLLVALQDALASTSSSIPCNGAASKSAASALAALQNLVDGEAVNPRPWPGASPRSLMRGTAGVAYALYRAACHEDRADLLVAADRWVRTGAKTPPEQSNGLEHGGLFEGDVGFYLVQALVSDAVDDPAGVKMAIDSLASRSALLHGSPALELQRGLAGELIACAFLLERGIAIERVRALGETLASDLLRRIEGLPEIGIGDAYPRLGMAHGWAGTLFGLLRWRTTQCAPHVQSRLAELARLARPVGDGLAWSVEEPRRHSAVQRDVVTWWCNGSAGQVQLWALAHELTGDPEFLELAIAAGRHVVSQSQGVADLCCGLGGRSFAMLTLYRRTREQVWLEHASRLADEARSRPRPEDSSLSLLKGDLGLALLELELTDPMESRFPIIEPW